MNHFFKEGFHCTLYELSAWLVIERLQVRYLARSGRRIFFSSVNFLCWLLFWYLFHTHISTVAHKGSWSFCQKCRRQVTASMHTPPQLELMLVYKEVGHLFVCVRFVLCLSRAGFVDWHDKRVCVRDWKFSNVHLLITAFDCPEVTLCAVDRMLKFKY